MSRQISYGNNRGLFYSRIGLVSQKKVAPPVCYRLGFVGFPKAYAWSRHHHGGSSPRATSWSGLPGHRKKDFLERQPDWQNTGAELIVTSTVTAIAENA